MLRKRIRLRAWVDAASRPRVGQRDDKHGQGYGDDARRRHPIPEAVERGVRGRDRQINNGGTCRSRMPEQAPTLRIERGSRSRQGRLQGGPAGFSRAYRREAGVLVGRPGALERGGRRLEDKQLRAAADRGAAHVGKRGLEADQWREAEIAVAHDHDLLTAFPIDGGGLRERIEPTK